MLWNCTWEDDNVPVSVTTSLGINNLLINTLSGGSAGGGVGALCGCLGVVRFCKTSVGSSRQLFALQISLFI